MGDELADEINVEFDNDNDEESENDSVAYSVDIDTDNEELIEVRKKVHSLKSKGIKDKKKTVADSAASPNSPTPNPNPNPHTAEATVSDVKDVGGDFMPDGVGDKEYDSEYIDSDQYISLESSEDECVTNVASSSRGRQSRKSRSEPTQITQTRSPSRRQSQPTPPRTMSIRATPIKATENVPVTQPRPKQPDNYLDGGGGGGEE
ncbi:hypothetical protein LguiB_015670 [Lonicera macranthoides]